MTLAAVIVAALALGLAAFALYVALAARARGLAAESRIARHQQEHRTGIEDEGLRRHRAGEPALTGQIPVVRAGSDPVERRDLPPMPEQTRRPLPPPGRIGRP